MLLKAADNESVRNEAARQLDELRPTTLHFLADPYDDTCSTIFPLLSNVLTTVSLPYLPDIADSYGLVQLKKAKRSSQENFPEPTRSFLSTALSTILKKMKWDEEQDPEDMDDDDKHAFETFRKVTPLLRLTVCHSNAFQGDLRVHLDSISVIETDLVLKTVESLIMTTFSSYQTGSPLKWNEVELAVYLVYIFGDINKSKSCVLLRVYCQV